jgi:AraC-like DNA-binding protein
MWHLSDLGVVGEVMRNSPTVGQALRKLVFYQHLNSDAAVPFIREAANVVDLGCAIYDGEFEGVEQFCDAYLAAAVNFLRELCGPAWGPTEVFLPHSTPADSAQYRQYFRVHPRFNAEFCALRFPAHWMDRPVDGANPARLRTAERRARARRGPPLLQQVYRALRILLLSGNSSGDDVATMLSMHRRTLNRRLKAEGTTFQNVLDHVRFKVACQLLGASEISLDEVAAALGYAGVSPFMRSFRRWAGTTPGRWRRMARRGEALGNER